MTSNPQKQINLAKNEIDGIGNFAQAIITADERLGLLLNSKPIVNGSGLMAISYVSYCLYDLAYRTLWMAQCGDKGEITENTIDSDNEHLKRLSALVLEKKTTCDTDRDDLYAPLSDVVIRSSRFNIFNEILNERIRQITKHGYTEAHDDEHTDGSIADAAAHYASTKDDSGLWPWDAEYDKKGSKTRRDQLITSISMLIAEVERIDRAEAIKENHNNKGNADE